MTALTNGNYVVSSHSLGQRCGDRCRCGDVGERDYGRERRGLQRQQPRRLHANDQVGRFGVTALTNGNYVVSSPWDNGAVTDAGAVTWGSGTTGSVAWSPGANSLVGSACQRPSGLCTICQCCDRAYQRQLRGRSPNWDNGAVTDAGAVTWGSGTAGVSGVVSSANSLVGSTASDQVGIQRRDRAYQRQLCGQQPVWDNGARPMPAR